MIRAKLYYGNGNCSIEGSNISGVQIAYKGKISLIDRTSSSFHIAHRNNKIVIFPTKKGVLNNLFDYVGEIKIISIVVSDNIGNKVSTGLHEVMDYAELIGTNSEDMTMLAEELNSNYIYKYRLSKKHSDSSIITNLNTASEKSTLRLANHKQYHGAFHVHITPHFKIMTGAPHTEDSQPLFYSKKGSFKLLSPKNYKINNRKSPNLNIQQNRRRISARRKAK